MHDGLSIRMLQMGSDSISKPLSLMFWNCLKASYFLAAWKKANVEEQGKKGNKKKESKESPQKRKQTNFEELSTCSPLTY